jgi:hypothetical protein
VEPRREVLRDLRHDVGHMAETLAFLLLRVSEQGVREEVAARVASELERLKSLLDREGWARRGADAEAWRVVERSNDVWLVIEHDVGRITTGLSWLLLTACEEMSVAEGDVASDLGRMKSIVESISRLMRGTLGALSQPAFPTHSRETDLALLVDSVSTALLCCRKSGPSPFVRAEQFEPGSARLRVDDNLLFAALYSIFYSALSFGACPCTYAVRCDPLPSSGMRAFRLALSYSEVRRESEIHDSETNRWMEYCSSRILVASRAIHRLGGRIITHSTTATGAVASLGLLGAISDALLQLEGRPDAVEWHRAVADHRNPHGAAVCDMGRSRGYGMQTGACVAMELYDRSGNADSGARG